MVQCYFVEGKSQNPQVIWYASLRMPYEPFTLSEVPLCRSRFRNNLKVFSNKESAHEFVKEHGQSVYQEVCDIRIQPISAELSNSLVTVEAERSAILKRLLVKVDQVMENFDFNKAQQITISTRTTFEDSKAPPTVEQLKIIARYLLVMAAHEDNEVFNGMFRKLGLSAWRSPEHLTLSFELGPYSIHYSTLE